MSAKKDKQKIHIIKYTNTLQPSDSRTPVCPCATVINNNTSPVTWQSFNIVSILCIGANASVFYHFPATDLLCIITFSDSHVSFAQVLTSFATLSRSSSAILSSKLCWRTQARCCSCCSSCSMDLIWKAETFSQCKRGETVLRCVKRQLFILLKWVYPSALLLRCPWHAAEHKAWKLSPSRGEALEGLRMNSSQVGQLRSNKTHTPFF